MKIEIQPEVRSCLSSQLHKSQRDEPSGHTRLCGFSCVPLWAGTVMLGVGQRHWCHPRSVWAADRPLPPQGGEKPKQTPSKKVDRRVWGPEMCIETILAPLAISCIIGELEVLMPTKINRNAAPDRFGLIDNADL